MDKESLIRKKNRLMMYYEAEEKILSGQSYTIGNRSLTRADLDTVLENIKKLENEIAVLEGRRSKARRVIPF